MIAFANWGINVVALKNFFIENGFERQKLSRLPSYKVISYFNLEGYLFVVVLQCAIGTLLKIRYKAKCCTEYKILETHGMANHSKCQSLKNSA